MTATLADDSVLVTDFDADPATVSNPIVPASAGYLGDRLILAPQEISPQIQEHEIREAVAHVAEVLAQGAYDSCDPFSAGSRQQRSQRIDIDVVPGEDAVRTAPVRGDRAQQQIERAS